MIANLLYIDNNSQVQKNLWKNIYVLGHHNCYKEYLLLFVHIRWTGKSPNTGIKRKNQQFRLLISGHIINIAYNICLGNPGKIIYIQLCVFFTPEMENGFEANSRQSKMANGPIIFLNPHYRWKLGFQNIFHLVTIFYWRQLASKPLQFPEKKTYCT